jgi:hypothetical protein
VSPVKYKLGFCIPEDDILHSHCRENIKSYIALTGWTLWRRRNVSPVGYELGFYYLENGILIFYYRQRKDSILWSQDERNLLEIPYTREFI